ncbi:general substrate transporter [Thamnidium elegans]|nr:general substrate transporter [Thamnidium elegans]
MSELENLITEVTPLIQQRQSRKLVYLYASTAAVGGFICGYDTGSISSIIALPIFQRRFFLYGSLAFYQSILLASYLVTSMMGAFSSGYFCDAIGRKHSMLLSSFLLSTGIIFELIGLNATTLLIGRLVGGIGTGLMTNAIPLYQSEIAPSDIRGRLISIFSLLVSFGQMVGYFITFGTSYLESDWSWRVPWLIQLTLCFLFSISLIILPYSPRWLIDQGRTSEALEILTKLHNSSQVAHQDYLEIKSLKDTNTSTYYELFQGTNLKRTLYSFFISIATCFAGNVIISYFAPQIFKNAGLGEVSISLALAGGTGFLSLLFTALSLGWWIDIWGRKMLFFIGSFISAICMIVIGLMFQSKNIYAQYTIIFCIYLFSASFAGTWGVANYVYTAEVFSMKCRAKGLSLTYAISWACSIFITYCTPYFLAYSISGVYFFFGACSIITLIGITLIPETKGKSLEQIDFMF